MNMIDYLTGFRLIETNVITKEVQARKHQKKRVNKKWLKRYGLKTMPDYEKIIVANDCILAQPKTIEWIKNSVDVKYLEM